VTPLTRGFSSDTPSWSPASSGASPSREIFTRYRLDEFETVGDCLGSGSYGQVNKVIRRSTGEVFAMKAIPKQRIVEHEMTAYLFREVKTQIQMRHPNILRLYYYFEDAKNVLLLLEYADCGSLFSVMRKRKKLPENEVARIFVDIAGALDYLHQKGIVHRDLKPENVLMCSGGLAKLADFGWCAEVTKDNAQRHTFCGTWDYLSPEMVNNEPHDFTVDIWAIGVLLYELLVGQPPFVAANQAKAMQRIMKVDLKVPPSIAPAARDLLSRVLVKEPRSRLSLANAARHPWAASLVPEAAIDAVFADARRIERRRAEAAAAASGARTGGAVEARTALTLSAVPPLPVSTSAASQTMLSRSASSAAVPGAGGGGGSATGASLQAPMSPKPKPQLQVSASSIDSSGRSTDTPSGASADSSTSGLPTAAAVDVAGRHSPPRALSRAVHSPSREGGAPCAATPARSDGMDTTMSGTTSDKRELWQETGTFAAIRRWVRKSGVSSTDLGEELDQPLPAGALRTGREGIGAASSEPERCPAERPCAASPSGWGDTFAAVGDAAGWGPRGMAVKRTATHPWELDLSGMSSSSGAAGRDAIGAGGSSGEQSTTSSVEAQPLGAEDEWRSGKAPLARVCRPLADSPEDKLRGRIDGLMRQIESGSRAHRT